MLQREAELRLAPETQKAYYEAESGVDNDYSWMEVTSELQRRVVREFGFGGDGDGDAEGGVSAEAALGELRAAAPRNMSIAWWQKLVQGKAKRGTVRAGDAIPTVELWTTDDEAGSSPGASSPVGLSSLVPADGRPLAVVALSYS